MSNVSCQIGRNCAQFTINGLSVWFSYNTPVAFQLAGYPAVVRENAWGPTTGKHLNAIDGGAKSARVDGNTFQELLDVASGATRGDEIQRRLAALRIELRCQRISTGELIELTGLAAHIDPSDTELLEAAGVAEKV